MTQASPAPDHSAEEDFKPLTREQVLALDSEVNPVQPGAIVLAQFAVAVAGALVAFGLSGRANVALSAGLGGLIAAVPNGLLAYGITRSRLRGTVLGFWVWEAVKILASIMAFVVVAVVVPSVEWVPLLLTFAVALKMVWLAAIKRSKPKL